MENELKKKHLLEIKILESEYSRNLHRINFLQETQKDITSRIQIILSKFK